MNQLRGARIEFGLVLEGPVPGLVRLDRFSVSQSPVRTGEYVTVNKTEQPENHYAVSESGLMPS